MSARDKLIAALVKASDAVCATPLLQPADVFVELAGEEFRKRLFTTEGPSGERLCLRPDFTIPVVLDHLASGHATPAVYAYEGKVFRKRRRYGHAEFEQTGTEWLGHGERIAADAGLFALAIRCADIVGLSPVITMGDAALFKATLGALGLSPAWRARLSAAYGDPVRMDNALQRLATPEAGNGVAARFAPALAEMAPAQARAVVEAMVGHSTVAGRSAADIADRLLAGAARNEDPANAAVIADYLSIETPLPEAPGALHAFAARHGLALAGALDDFAARADAFARHAIDLSSVTFAARFGRRLGYYTGFVFEMVHPARPGAEVIAGGRYDGLAALLDQNRSLPAIGFSVWLDRLP